MTHRFLLFITLVLFALSTVFLFWQNERELDPNLGKDWWIIAFVSPPEQENLSFTLENHSVHSRFRYTITVQKAVLFEDILTVNKGETATLHPPLTAADNQRTVITVNPVDAPEKNSQKIYR